MFRKWKKPIFFWSHCAQRASKLFSCWWPSPEHRLRILLGWKGSVRWLTWKAGWGWELPEEENRKAYRQQLPQRVIFCCNKSEFMSQKLHFLFFLTDFITYSDFVDLLDFYKLRWFSLGFCLHLHGGFPFSPWEWDCSAWILQQLWSQWHPQHLGTLSLIVAVKRNSHLIPLYLHQLWLSTLLVQ